MTSTNTATNDVAFYGVLAEQAQKLLTKNAKKTGLDKITVEVRDGVARTYPNLIQIKEGFNFRDLNTVSAKEGIRELAEQIAENGVLQTIVLFKEGDTYYAEDGHRRLAAVDYAIRELGAEIQTVPVRLSPKGGNDSDRIFTQFILNTGEKPTALETATIFKKLLASGWTEVQIQQKTRLSKTRVAQILDLNTLPTALHNLIRHSDVEVKPSFVHERFTINKRDGEKTIREIEAAIATARDQGYDRATNKHLPADAEPGLAARRNAPQTQSAPAPQNTPASDTVLPEPDTTPAADAPRPRLNITPGAPANVSAPGAQTTGTKPNNNSEFRKALVAYFSRLEINNFARDGKTIPDFNAGSFTNEEEWVIIRDNLGL